MAKYYLSAVDSIKSKPYRVLAPAFYYPYLPESLLHKKTYATKKIGTTEMKPMYQRPRDILYEPKNINQLEVGNYTIEIMIDMFMKKIEFSLVNEDDVPIILDEVDRYLVTLEEDIAMGDERVIAYATLVIQWRAELYKLYYRYMKTHPSALNNLYPNGDPKNNLMYVMSTIGTGRGDMRNMDPLRAKANPPFEIDAIKPRDKNADGTVGGVDDYLGISSEPTIELDDDAKFDMEDFLKRG